MSLDKIHPDLHHLAVPIEELHPDPKNANTHPEASLKAIASVFEEFRQLKNLTGWVDDQGCKIVSAGNGALEALAARGWTHLAVLMTGHDATTAKAWGLADNASSRGSRVDPVQAGSNLQELLDEKFEGMSSLGFDDDEIDTLLRGEPLAGMLGTDEPDEPGSPATPEPEPKPPPDEPELEPPPPPREPDTKPGQVFTIGLSTIHCRDCMEVMAELPDNSVDAIVTDPPYGLSPDGRARTWDEIEELRKQGKGPKVGFMGAKWDAGVPGETWAREVLRVLKPGGHLCSQSSTRTYHRHACAIEDAGFEIKDTVSLQYYSGFPKSLNISAAIDEVLGRDREVVESRATGWVGTLGGTGAFAGVSEDVRTLTAPASDEAIAWDGWGTALKPSHEPACLARKPIDTFTPAEVADLLGGDFYWTRTKINANPKTVKDREALADACERWGRADIPEGAVEWKARPLRQELAGRYELRVDGVVIATREGPGFSASKLSTVALNVLITPPGGTVLETFGGSGTTAVAATRLGFRSIVCELDPGHTDIIRARVAHEDSKKRGLTP